MFADLAGRKLIGLRIAVPEGGLEVFADKERVLQVLSNLVGNAIKFTPENGKIDLSARPADEMVLVSVSDTGPGIVSRDVPHLFERFWKADSRARRGAGLGLYIAKGIVDAHGGKIWVETDLGSGTTFHFTLPRPSPSERESSASFSSSNGQT
jgi:signal transduction histidine kinase